MDSIGERCRGSRQITIEWYFTIIRIPPHKGSFRIDRAYGGERHLTYYFHSLYLQVDFGMHALELNFFVFSIVQDFKKQFGI